MLDFTRKSSYDFYDLVRVVQLLRGPNGCPWDRVQTHESIRRNFIEETYEACEAMDEHDPAHLKEELGDVLLQVVFHALIEQDAGSFGVDEVCDGVCKKLIERHPHLFYENQTRQDWDEVKSRLRGEQTVTQAMQGVAKTLPALWQADKLLAKAEKSGLYRNDPAEAAQLLTDRTQPQMDEQALGSALFALARLARANGLDPEAALIQQCRQFIGDFSALEAGEASAVK